jgi:hypothetical protein
MSADQEIEAIRSIQAVLAALPPDAACRVLGYVLDRMDEPSASSNLYARARLIREVERKRGGTTP